nr:hypothetical protein CFP56_01748 [Quercus suber]
MFVLIWRNPHALPCNYEKTPNRPRFHQTHSSGPKLTFTANRNTKLAVCCVLSNSNSPGLTFLLVFVFSPTNFFTHLKTK